MPLLALPAPEPALRCAVTALGSPTAVHRDRTPALSSQTGPLSPDSPLPVHVLEHVDGRQEPPRSRLTGWRFLIRNADRAVAAAETVLTADGWAFSHFFEGPYIASTERALAQAAALPTAYQPRLLSVPGLYMLTLWLRAETGAEASGGQPAPADLLVPLAPAPPGIASHRPHPVAELLPLLRLRSGPDQILLPQP
ncbi:hypothetical protein [Streptomyces sp. TP-A0874]|uniref:hypothetical protein n=1 Tax=Streptomyces sp. TP-A0874 TaxID=549819 RepID=UPI0008536ECB|nr:hypothetical protein [Streptomyces sp. TP-A0874]